MLLDAFSRCWCPMPRAYRSGCRAQQLQGLIVHVFPLVPWNNKTNNDPRKNTICLFNILFIMFQHVLDKLEKYHVLKVNYGKSS